jgi:mRNA interferase MazF
LAVYVPDRGDVVWLQFDPQAGHEQAGTRPALVLSPRLYNRKAGLGLFCPITSKAKGYPFEVSLPSDLPVHGVVLSDQVKSFDWRVRRARYACALNPLTLDEVIGKVLALIDPREDS